MFAPVHRESRVGARARPYILLWHQLYLEIKCARSSRFVAVQILHLKLVVVYYSQSQVFRMTRSQARLAATETNVSDIAIHQPSSTSIPAQESESSPQKRHSQRQKNQRTKASKPESKKLKESSGPSFLSLPPEIRVKIYHEMLCYDRILVRKAKARRAAGLILTNRLVYSEAAAIFYEANVFQVPICERKDSKFAIANVQHMRQCCLELEVERVPGKDNFVKLLYEFVDRIQDGGKMECLLFEAWEYKGYYSAAYYFECLLGIRQIHLAQVVVYKKRSWDPQWRARQDKWCQQLERSLMARDSSPVEFGDRYTAVPKIGIDLEGDTLDIAKRTGGWIIQDDDLYVLFGKSGP